MPSKTATAPPSISKPLVEREKNPREYREEKRQTPRRNLRTVNAHRETGLSAHHRTLPKRIEAKKLSPVDLTQYFPIAARSSVLATTLRASHSGNRHGPGQAAGKGNPTQGTIAARCTESPMRQKISSP